jgi:hypothetical protein
MLTAFTCVPLQDILCSNDNNDGYTWRGLALTYRANGNAREWYNDVPVRKKMCSLIALLLLLIKIILVAWLVVYIDRAIKMPYNVQICSYADEMQGASKAATSCSIFCRYSPYVK